MRPWRKGYLPLLALALAAGSLWVFTEVVEEVFLEGSQALDRMILLAFRSSLDPAQPLGPDWLRELARDLTALGSTGILTLLTVAAVLFLFLVRKWGTALYVTGAIVCGAVLVNLLKVVFGRPRPDIAPMVSELHTMSFPSGHAAMSAIVYLTLAALIARVLPNLRVKAYIIGLGMFVTMLVGMTRVYLGFHWPSDVIGGWALGAAWALLWCAAAEWHLPDRSDGMSTGVGRTNNRSSQP